MSVVRKPPGLHPPVTVCLCPCCLGWVQAPCSHGQFWIPRTAWVSATGLCPRPMLHPKPPKHSGRGRGTRERHGRKGSADRELEGQGPSDLTTRRKHGALILCRPKSGPTSTVSSRAPPGPGGHGTTWPPSPCPAPAHGPPCTAPEVTGANSCGFLTGPC